MEIFFHDPDDVPLPPEEVHIREFKINPYPDGRRVKVYLEITPFQKKPSGEITIFNKDELVVASASIIETIDPKMEMTMHLRGPISGSEFTAKADLFYVELPELEENGQEKPAPQIPERKMVDQTEISFRVEN